MSKTQFRVVDPEHEHSRDYARRKVKQWRSDAERHRLPVTTLTGEKPLDVDGVLRATLRPDVTAERRRWWRLWR